MTIAEFRPYHDKTVILTFHDGEIATVKIALVDADHEEIIVDIVHTSRPEQYKGPTNSAYTLRAADIASVDKISN